MSDDTITPLAIKRELIDRVTLAEDTPFCTIALRCTYSENRVIDALIQEILNLKEQIRGMQRDFGSVSRLIENLENK